MGEGQKKWGEQRIQSRLHADSRESPMQGSNLQTVRSWPELKLDTQPTEPPSLPNLDILFEYNMQWRYGGFSISLWTTVQTSFIEKKKRIIFSLRLYQLCYIPIPSSLVCPGLFPSTSLFVYHIVLTLQLCNVYWCSGNKLSIFSFPINSGALGPSPIRDHQLVPLHGKYTAFWQNYI